MRKIPEHKAQISCMRCGKCCLADMPACAAEEDIRRWRDEKRYDILHVMENQHAVWAGDHFVSSSDGRYLTACPFIIWMNGGGTACGIYNTRPKVCRDFLPGSSEICPRFNGVPKN